MIRLALRDLQHTLITSGFNLVSLGILIFAFLLLLSLSQAVSNFGEAGGLHQNLIVLEHGVLQPEESRIPQGMEQRVGEILGDGLARVDPVIFRIMRVEDHVIQLRGVAQDSWVPTFRLQLTEGAWPARDDQIVIGQLATQGTGWHVGSRITIYGRSFTVSGVVQGAGTQAMSVWMSYVSAHQLFGPDKGAQLLAASLKPNADPVVARQALEDGLVPPGSFDAYFEDSLLSRYGAALNDLRALGLLTTIIGVAAVILGSHNLAWLAAEERVRLLGLLRTLGFGRRAVAIYLLLRAAVITGGAYLLAVAGVQLFFLIGLGGAGLTISGSQSDLSLDPSTVLLGLVLAGTSALVGTWLSSRRVLASSPADLLGRGPGGLGA